MANLYLPSQVSKSLSSICWFNFDALAQGNTYKPTKEPINYRGLHGDWTHNLQTEATPPAASCPAHSLHAIEILSKNTIPMTCPRCTRQLTIRLECEGINFKTCAFWFWTVPWRWRYTYLSVYIAWLFYVLPWLLLSCMQYHGIYWTLLSRYLTWLLCWQLNNTDGGPV